MKKFNFLINNMKIKNLKIKQINGFEEVEFENFLLKLKGKYYLINVDKDVKNATTECSNCKCCKYGLVNLTKQIKTSSCFDYMYCEEKKDKKEMLELLLTLETLELVLDENEIDD